MEPKVSQKKPYVMEMKAGEYWWCACGHSQAQPFCDGSHKKMNTGIQPVKATIAEKKTVAWCGCKRTAGPPFCDGSHKTLAG